ncbi:MerC domain-containing protein [Massilia niastensis]|uniref:MerC domain-containing protein n=1 Tax=Massilia niastensis TaxID=544911 RepID=UPI0003A99038|nr:MerC domain-containing protein [Massilia niastensis]
MKGLIRFGDYAGMTASALCLAHCLAMPLLLAAFPMLGLAHAHDGFHDTLLAAISLPVLLALLPGYLRHRDARVLAAGIAGLGCFLAAVFVISPLFGELAEAGCAIASGVLLLYAHLRNRRLCACCAAARPSARAAAAARE